MKVKASALDRDQFWSHADLNYIERIGEVRCCLVMVPHPDDESLACAGLIAMLASRGTKIRIILTTDGSMSHPNSKKYPSQKLFELRKKELENALSLMGVASKHILYYASKDGSMPTIGEFGFEDLVHRLKDDLQVMQPDLILVPYELDSHPDHKATHQLLISAIAIADLPKPKIWEYPVWLYERAHTGEVPKLLNGELIAVDIEAYLELKKRCIYTHKSQTTGFIDDDPTGFMLSKGVIENFIQGKEYFMEREKLNPKSTLSEKYFDDVYSNNDDPWSFETSEYERGKYLATIEALPVGNYLNGLEIGCSIGVLTIMLTARCSHLLAIDINEFAVAKARERLAGNTNVDFLIGAIPEHFPSGSFDLIVMSEVGYYFAMKDLLLVRAQIWNGLTVGGILILVHWIHFVPDYPLSGDDVHNCFEEFDWTNFKDIRTADYRLSVYKKN